MNRRRIGLLTVLLAFGATTSVWAGPAAPPTTAPAITAPATTAPATAAPAKQVPYEPAYKLRDGKPDERFARAHQLFLDRIKQGPIGLLFIGDSITAGWNKHKPLWERTFGLYQPANFGISGDRTQQVLWRLDNGELEIAPSPKVVVLMIGTNNVRHDAPEDIARGVRAIIDRIRTRHPTTKLLLLGVLPMGVNPAEPAVARDRERITQINRHLASLAAPDVVFLDMGQRFLKEDGTTSDAMASDGVHLEAGGYEIWADAIAPALARMAGQPGGE